MADKLRKGTPTDIVILTAALSRSWRRRSWSSPPRSPTSVWSRPRSRFAPAIRKSSSRTPPALRAALLASDAIFVPDTKVSTAGIHVAKVLQQLGIAEKWPGRLRIYPNGATAMRHLAASDARRPIGCTQATEIIATEGIVLSGSLPPGCDLATMYTAAVTTGTAAAQQAQSLIDLLTAADANELRSRAGFVSRSN